MKDATKTETSHPKTDGPVTIIIEVEPGDATERLQEAFDQLTDRKRQELPS